MDVAQPYCDSPLVSAVLDHNDCLGDLSEHGGKVTAQLQAGYDLFNLAGVPYFTTPGNGSHKPGK